MAHAGYHPSFDSHVAPHLGCPVVLYTCLFGRGKMHAPPKELRGCAIAFTDQPRFVARHFWTPRTLALNTSKLSVRRLSRLAKIRSHLFFSSPSIYLDSKLQWPSALKVQPFLRDTLFRCKASFVAYAHPKRAGNPMAEFEALTWHHQHGHGRSGNLTKALEQRERFRRDLNFQAHVKRGAARMIDGSLIIRRPTLALKTFEDAWWASYLAGSDRDQPAFAYAMFTSGLVDVRCGGAMLILRQTRKTPRWAQSTHYSHPRGFSSRVKQLVTSAPAAQSTASECCPHHLPTVSCTDWLSSACFDGPRRIIYTNDTKVLVARRVLLPTDYAHNASIEIRPVSSEQLSILSSRRDVYGGSRRWLDGTHLLDTWRNAQSQDLSHIGHFMVSIGSLFSYSRLLKSCMGAASVCNGLLLFRTTHEGSPLARKYGLHKSWEMHSSWAKTMLPIVLDSATMNTCAGRPPLKFPHVASLNGIVCSHNFLVEAAYDDVYARPADYERWRAKLTRHFGFVRPINHTTDQAVLIVQRSHNRVIKNLPAVLSAAKQICSRVTVARLKEVGKWSPADQMRLFSRHTVFISTSGSHIANLIAAEKGSTWIEVRNAGLRQGISAFAEASGLRHLTYVNRNFNLTSGKWPNNPGHREQCEREATEFRRGDSRQRQKKTWPPCFMNWDLEVRIPKLRRLIQSALQAASQ